MHLLPSVDAARAASPHRRRIRRAISLGVERLEGRTLLSATQLTDIKYDFDPIEEREHFPQIIEVASLGGTLYFAVAEAAAVSGSFGTGTTFDTLGFELWATDGTPDGERKLGRFNQLFDLTAAGSTLYFVANDGQHGRELWASDGTEQGTRMVIDLSATGESGILGHLAALNDIVVFFGINTAGDMGLFRSDGTASGTELVRGDSSGLYTAILNRVPNTFAQVGDTLFFTGVGEGGNELWKTDGTTDGTVLVADLRVASPGSDPVDFVAGDGVVYFWAEDFVHGRELWRSDGTELGTVMVADLRPGRESSYYGRPLFANGLLYFPAFVEPWGVELWKSDGTLAGTSLVRDISPAPPSFPGVLHGSFPEQLTALGGSLLGDRLVFSAWDDGPDSHGIEMWTTDPTGTNTQLVKDINRNRAGAGSSRPRFLTAIDGVVYFGASDGIHDRVSYGETNQDGSLGAVREDWELWRSDATEDGTWLASDLEPGPNGSRPRLLANLNGALLFVADQGDHPYASQLYRYVDGPYGSFRFESDTIQVREDIPAGNFVVTVARIGGTLGSVSVDYATIEGTATASVDFQPVSGRLDFGPLEGTKNIVVPIRRDNLTELAETFRIVLSNPAGGAVLGVPFDVTVTILNVPDQPGPDPGPGPGPGDETPPTVIALKTAVRRRVYDSLIVTFSESVTPATALSLATYRLIKRGRDGRFGTKDDRLVRWRSAKYDEASRSVTLVPEGRQSIDQVLLFKVLAGTVADQAGNQLRPEFVRKLRRGIIRR